MNGAVIITSQQGTTSSLTFVILFPLVLNAAEMTSSVI